MASAGVIPSAFLLKIREHFFQGNSSRPLLVPGSLVPTEAVSPRTPQSCLRVELGGLHCGGAQTCLRREHVKSLFSVSLSYKKKSCSLTAVFTILQINTTPHLNHDYFNSELFWKDVRKEWSTSRGLIFCLSWLVWRWWNRPFILLFGEPAASISPVKQAAQSVGWETL